MAKKSSTKQGNANDEATKPQEGDNPDQGSGTAKGSPDAAEAPPKGKTKAPEVDPLTAQHKEIDAQLGKLYDELVEDIKAAAVPGATSETAEQMRAGAVQFLRQCNATLEAARQLVEDGRKIVEDNNRQIQSIEKAKADLEKRSDAYRRMTNPETGEKNQ